MFIMSASERYFCLFNRRSVYSTTVFPVFTDVMLVTDDSAKSFMNVLMPIFRLSLLCSDILRIINDSAQLYMLTEIQIFRYSLSCTDIPLITDDSAKSFMYVMYVLLPIFRLSPGEHMRTRRFQNMQPSRKNAKKTWRYRAFTEQPSAVIS